jgi:hypothetical protein
VPYFTITDFAAGLDLRRSALTAPPGTLRKLVNCHLTPGGEIEKRYTFQKVGTVGADTRGIVEVGGQLFVFKLDLTGAVPAGSPAGTTTTFYPSAVKPADIAPPTTTPPGWGIGTIMLQGMSASDSPITEVFDYDTYGGSVFAITYHAGSAAPDNIRRFYKGLYLKQVASVDAQTQLFNPVGVTLSNGNLTFKQTAATGDNGARGPSESDGKFYFEIKVDTVSGAASSMGLLLTTATYNNLNVGTNCVAIRIGTNNI